MPTDTLRQLIDHAASGGADPAWLRQAADTLVAEALELAELRRCADPSKRATLRLATRISQADRAMREAGTEHRVQALCARFRRGTYG